jgi:CII-binding regulator of phage lambda lysogenization HflD
MGWNKEGSRDEQPVEGRYRGQTVLAAETLRHASSPVVAPEPAKGEERLSVFWRVFGGTLLSITALVCITVYQQFNGSLNELRHGLNALHETRADLVKKDEFSSRMTSVWNGIKELQAAHAAAAAAKERITLLEQQLKASEEDRKELTREFQRLRERLAALEGRQAAGTATKASLQRKK